MSFPRLLMILQLPPPINGASLINEVVFESRDIDSRFDVVAINNSMNSSQTTLRSFSLKKLWVSLGVVMSCLYQLVFRRPDVVYYTIAPTGWAFFRDLAFAVLLKLFRIKTVYHSHGMGMTKHMQQRPKLRRLAKWVFAGSTHVVVSEVMATDLEAIVDEADIRIVRNGIDDPHAHLGRPAAIADIKPRPTDPVRILYLSNLIPAKGALVLIETLGVLKKRGVPFHADFAGGWRQDMNPEQFQSYLEQADIEDSVTVHGPTYGADKAKLFESAAIFAMPTKYPFECCPVCITEAMSYGLAIVAAHHGGIPDILTSGSSAVLIDGYDPEQWADELAAAIADPELRARLGQAARLRFEQNHTVPVFEQRLCEALSDALRGNSDAQLVVSTQP